MLLKKISSLLILFDPLGNAATCECIGFSLRSSESVATEKVTLAIFMKTHRHVPEEKLGHWAGPISW